MTELPLAEGAVPPLGRRVLKALAFAGTARLFVQVASWLMTLFVMRLLTPTDYGLMALAAVFTGFVTVFNELGMGAALVQARKVTADLLRDLFGFVILLQLGFALLMVASAGPVAGFFDEPRLAPIIQLQSLQFLFLAFVIIPEAMLIRALDFQRKAVVDTVSALVASGSTLLLAWSGYGVWSLVYGILLGTATRALGVYWITRFFTLPRFRLSGLDGLLRFGGLLTLERLLWFGYTRFDSFIIGKRFGDIPLGHYTVAMTLASLPVEKLGPVLNQVSFPAFAEVQTQRDQATAHLMKAVRLLSLVFFPLLFGLSGVAKDLVPVLLGDHWTEAILPLSLIALIMPLRLVNLLIPSYLKGLGHPGASVLMMVAACLLLPAALLAGSNWGLAGISWAWVIAYPIFFLVSLAIAAGVTPLRVLVVLQAIARPAFAAGLMLLLVTVLSHQLSENTALLRLAACIAAGGLAYMAAMLLLDRKLCAELIALGRRR